MANQPRNKEFKKSFDKEGPPAATIKEITMLDGKVKKRAFNFKERKQVFSWVSKITGTKHIGAI